MRLLSNRRRARLALTAIILLGGTVMSAASASLKTEVRKTPRGPLLFVNGKETAPTILFVNVGAANPARYLQVRLDEIRAAARRGVNIVSLDTVMPWQQEGVETSFAATDGLIDAVLEANPNALIIPRFGITWPPRWWSDRHPDEMMLYDDGSRGIASIHSRVWRKDAAANVAAFVRRLEQKYGGHMLGYHTSGQNTGEWFYDRGWEGRLSGYEPPGREAFRAWLKQKYKTQAALRLAWHSPSASFESIEPPSFRERTRCKAGYFRDPLIEQKVIDFFEFESQDMATAVEELCGAIRSAAPDKITVQFYGYPFELSALPFGPQPSGHLATSYLLKSPDLDVMCSPVSYLNRAPGGGGFFMAPVDSVQAHGKLWLVEDDTRTCFSDESEGYGRCSTFEETIGVLTRNFANYATRGAAVWWMDLPGKGWFQGDDLWDHLSGLQNIYQAALGGLEPYRADIAVILDETSCLFMRPNRDFSGLVIGAFRQHWYRIGAPAGIYLLDDLIEGRVPPAKMYVMLNAFSLSTAQAEKLRSKAFAGGSTVVWMYAPGIVRDGKLRPEGVSEVAGMDLSPVSASGGIVLEGTGEEFAAGHGALSPMFAVSDDDARVLARYAGSGEAAVAEKQTDGRRNVYSGVLQLPSSLLRRLAREAGAHIYSEENDVITAGNGLVGIHASSTGKKTIRLPSECDVVDAVSGVSLGRGASFTFDMKLGETRLLRVR